MRMSQAPDGLAPHVASVVAAIEPAAVSFQLN